MIEVRPTQASDVEALAALHVRTWQIAYAGTIPEEVLDGLDVAEFATRRRDNLRLPDTFHFIATVDGALAGFADCGPKREGPPEADLGELYSIYVAPEYWAVGVGHALFEQARAALVGAGYAAMLLWVLEDNARARGFYARHGMWLDGERALFRPRHTTIEIPEVRYRLDLRSTA